MSRGYFYILNQVYFYNFTFQTDFDSPSDGTFSPALAVINGELPTWNLIGGTEYVEQTGVTQSDRTTTETLDASELDGTTQNISVTFSTNDPTNITAFNAPSDFLVGALDISLFTSLTTLNVSNNNLTSIVNPTISGAFTNYNIDDNSITELDVSMMNLSGSFRARSNGITTLTLPTNSNVFTYFGVNTNNFTSLDLRGLTGLGGQLFGFLSPNLETVLFPESSQTWSQINFRTCKLTGVLDLSPLDNLANLTIFYGNSFLTGVINPTTSSPITQYYFYSCGLTGTLDVSGLTGLSDNFRAYLNDALTSVAFPPTTNIFNSIWLNDCDLGYIDFTVMTNCIDINDATIRLQGNLMTAAEVNQILVDIDSITDGLYTGRSINISGDNAAPDSSSGGFDGDAAIVSLATKNITVTAS